jgi:hypothetical protein
VLLVGLPKKRVIEIGSQNTFVSVPDDAGGITVGIEDCQKMREQFAAGIVNREVF